MTSCGRLFHKRLSMSGNTRSTTVVSRVRRIVSRDDDDKRRERRLDSDCYCKTCLVRSCC